MFKKRIILLLIINLIIICGCTKKINKFYLEDKYYNNGEFININEEELSKIDKENYALYIYNTTCGMAIHCEDIFKSFMNEYKIDFLSMPISSFMNTKLYNKVKYAPSVIIVKNNKVVAYLDASKDEDIEKYQDVSKFEEWISKYIYLENKKG